MYQVLLSQVFEGLKDLDGESPNQAKGNSFEIIVFDELVEIYREKFKGND